jgi:hypothetical protein
MGPGNEDVMYLYRRGLKKEKAWYAQFINPVLLFSHGRACTSAASTKQAFAPLYII